MCDDVKEIGQEKWQFLTQCYPEPFSNSCPPAYNGCFCECHRTPGIMHCMPCCGPGINDHFK